MKDTYGRKINYMRISITDRCNYRCQYCMPNGVEWTSHEEILSYEEILRMCQVAIKLGITNFKVTGGEPMVRQGVLDFLRMLKSMDGVDTVTITTNGSRLLEMSKDLKRIGIDCINVSLDTMDRLQYDQLTGTKDQMDQVIKGIWSCMELGIPVKLNTVLLRENRSQILALGSMAIHYPITVKFIEVMPVGYGRKTQGLTAEETLNILRNKWTDLTLDKSIRGNGPAQYYSSKELKGAIGLIHAVSNPFCKDCNRIRLTSQGVLKPCLCYESGIDFRMMLREGASDKAIEKAFVSAIKEKPEEHCFSKLEDMTEDKCMGQIGG